jgi:hypothetical protein
MKKLKHCSPHTGRTSKEPVPLPKPHLAFLSLLDSAAAGWGGKKHIALCPQTSHFPLLGICLLIWNTGPIRTSQSCWEYPMRS